MIGLTLLASGCGSSAPARIEVQQVLDDPRASGNANDPVSKTSDLPSQGTQLAEGDLLVVRTSGFDGDDKLLDMCLDGSSSDPSVIEVHTVTGQCRTFVLLARKQGFADVTFGGRGTSATGRIEVTPLPP